MENTPSEEVESGFTRPRTPVEKKKIAGRVLGSLLTLGGFLGAKEASSKYIPSPQPKEVRGTSQITTIPENPHRLEYEEEPIKVGPTPVPTNEASPSPEPPRAIPTPLSENPLVGMEDEEVVEEQKTHKVEEGDTLDSIAQKYDVPLERLRGINALAPDSDLIVVGQELIIPRWGIVEQTNEQEHINEISRQFSVWVKFTLPQAMTPKEIADFFDLGNPQELIETNKINVNVEEQIPAGTFLVFSAGKGITFGEKNSFWNLRWTPRRNGLDVSQLIWLEPNTGKSGHPGWPNEAFFVIPRPTQYWKEAKWSSSNLDFKEHPERYHIIFATDKEYDTVLENSQGEKTVLKGREIIGRMLVDGPPALEYFPAGQWIDEEGKVFEQGNQEFKAS